MHLVVLGASRPRGGEADSLHLSRLNAPDGAGCFPTQGAVWAIHVNKVSMHLVVLGASRPEKGMTVQFKEYVSMHLMVLGASRPLGVLSVVPPVETGPGLPLARKRPWTGPHTAH